jgi:hypothetical protein
MQHMITAGLRCIFHATPRCNARRLHGGLTFKGDYTVCVWACVCMRACVSGWVAVGVGRWV